MNESDVTNVSVGATSEPADIDLIRAQTQLAQMELHLLKRKTRWTLLKYAIAGAAAGAAFWSFGVDAFLNTIEMKNLALQKAEIEKQQLTLEIENLGRSKRENEDRVKAAEKAVAEWRDRFAGIEDLATTALKRVENTSATESTDPTQLAASLRSTIEWSGAQAYQTEETLASSANATGSGSEIGWTIETGKWIYIGERSAGKWKRRYLDFDTTLAPNALVGHRYAVRSVPLNVRDRPFFGQIVGSARPGNSVDVKKYYAFGSDADGYIWAKMD